MNFPQGTRVYIDANLWIYFLSPLAEIENSLLSISRQVDEGTIVPITSILSWSECLVRPLREKNQEAKAWFDRTFTQTKGLVLMDISREVMFLASEIRAEVHKLRTPDAIHLASAKLARCEVFLTHDNDLLKAPLQPVMQPMVLQGLR